MLAQEIIRIKRDGQILSVPHIGQFVNGITTGAWSDGQVAAMAMAIFLCGMERDETVAFTQALKSSGQVLQWDAAELGGPVLDKHSTGGVGDKVSLMLGPIIAACGAFVPMISGRGLGHTGGTLDKFDSIPGYQTAPGAQQLRATVRAAGCAIVGQTAELAPADKRLYGIRDVTATVESIPLITASILSKKLAAGLHGLVMDVKIGNGAFAATPEMARALAHSLVQVANSAGLPTRALLTDMNQVLGRNCGNAVEVLEAIDFLAGTCQEPRLLEVTRALSAEMLLIGQLATDHAGALAKVDGVLTSGAALQCFARMVSGLGGPGDFVERPGHYLPTAPVQLPLSATMDGTISCMATRDIGLVVVELGGGRFKASDTIDHRVGITGVVAIGERVARGQTIATVHAADRVSGEAAVARLRNLIQISEGTVKPVPVLIDQINA